MARSHQRFNKKKLKFPNIIVGSTWRLYRGAFSTNIVSHNNGVGLLSPSANKDTSVGGADVYLFWGEHRDSGNVLYGIIDPWGKGEELISKSCGHAPPVKETPT